METDFRENLRILRIGPNYRGCRRSSHDPRHVWTEIISIFDARSRGVSIFLVRTDRDFRTHHGHFTFRKKKDVKNTPMAVALFITSAYWCTSSTSFANPAVTIARSLTDTFSG